MNKISEPQRYRTFLIEKLPEPLTKASSHLQILDRYLAGTAIRLRRIRDPQSNAVNYRLQKRSIFQNESGSYRRSDELHITETEYAALERYTLREVRKNRYFHEFDRHMLIFDVYLGDLSGLGKVRVELSDVDDRDDFEPPPFAVTEITGDPFFDSDSLAGAAPEVIRSQVERVGHRWPTAAAYQDE